MPAEMWACHIQGSPAFMKSCQSPNSAKWRVMKWSSACSASCGLVGKLKASMVPKLSGKRAAISPMTWRVRPFGSIRWRSGIGLPLGRRFLFSASKFQRPPAGLAPSISSPVLRRIRR